LCKIKPKKLQTILTEKIYTLEVIQPQIFYGPNNAYLDLIKSNFSTLKFVARGNEIKITGNEDVLEEFANRLKELENYFLKTGEINEHVVYDLFKGTENKKLHIDSGGQTLVIGTRGQKIGARTGNQKAMVAAASEKDVVFAIGPAGTGKTYTAVALAVRALKEREIRKIILTRPAVEAGEHLGFLPGDLKEKIDPYLRPLYDALEDMIPGEKLKSMIESGTIEIAPLAFMRGRTLDNCYVILDEAQNASHQQLKMFLTRMGPSAKMIITGDLTQIDLPRSQTSGLKIALDALNKIKGIAIIRLTTSDVVRHKLVKDIINAYEKFSGKEDER
jgi:phosphate starvation-inducible PhoH-like protein